MPTGFGYEDAQGQWRYGELDDAGALHSDLLEFGQSRVSAGFEADRERLSELEGLPKRAVNRMIGATNTLTNQTTFADLPNATDAAALQTTLVKKFAGTRLILTAHATMQLSSGSAQRLQLGIRIGSTDYLIASAFSPTAIARVVMSGSLEVSGVGAGTLTVKPRIRAQGASSVQLFNQDDSISYRIEEAW